MGHGGYIPVTHPKPELPRFSNRPHLWLRPGQPLVCPNLLNGYPHKIRTNAALLQHDAFVCQFKSSEGRAECGATIYVLVFPGNLRYVARVNTSELRIMREKQWDVADVLSYLGSTNPFSP